MQLDDYQASAEATAIYPDATTGQWNALTYTVLGLTGEAGEVANQTKKILRDDNYRITPERRTQLMAELGDVLWYVAMCATELDTTLEQIARDNLRKLKGRSQRGRLGGSGDQR